MKKQFYSKLLFLFALLLTVSTSAWAETGTIKFGSASGSTAINSTSVTGEDSQGNTWTITTVTSYDPSFTQNASYSQIGAAKKPATSVTFTATLPEAVNITAFSAKLGGFSGTAGDITLKVGDTSVGTGSLNAATDVTVSSTSEAEGNVLTITITNIAKGVKAYEINYTYTAIGGGSGTQTCAVPTFSPKAGTYAVAQSVELSTATEDATIHYTIDGSDPDASSTVYESAIAVNGTTTIKAIAMKDGMNNSAIASATYTIANLGHAGTVGDPYTVAAARAAIDANVCLTNVYATGIVSKIVTAYNSQYGNISYNISADGTEDGDQLQAYRGKSYNGDNFTSADDIQVGDEVVIYGNLKKHNDTYEFDANNQLVSLNRPVSVEPSIVVATTPVPVDYTGEENGEIEVTYNNIDNVSAGVQWFESDGSTPATYDWITAEINANNNISYHIEKNTGAARTAYLKVHVNDVYSDLITITQKKAPEKVTVTYYVAGEEFATAEYLEGETLNLPDPGARGGYQFAGWSKVNNAAAPQFVANDAAANSDLKKLYAIFVKGVGESVYKKVTPSEGITNGQYLIVYEDEDGNLAFNGSLEKLDAVGNTIEVEISEDNTIARSATVDAATFTIDATAGTIQSALGLYIGNTSDSNALAESAETAYTNTLSIDEEGNADIISSGGAHLRYNFASNQRRFRYYKSSTYTDQKAIQLYKQTASVTYTLNEPEVSISTAANATWVAPAKVEILTKGVKVYTVEYIADKSKVYKHEVRDKVVPANEAVLLTSDAATTVDVEVAVTDKPATDYNKLVNHLQGSKGNVQGGDNIYCLAVVDDVLGFYRVDSTIKVPAGKAYLDISSVGGESLAPSYLWFNGDTTAIDSLTTDTAAGNENGEIYSLTGQRVGKNYRGIVIMNGRKVLKK